MKLRYILLAAPLLLCGCDSTQLLRQSTPDFDKAYEITADIDYGNFSAAAEIARSSSGEWLFSFIEPAYLMGVEIALSDGVLTASLGNISVTSENDGYTLIPDVIADALDSLPALSPENVTEDANGVFTLNTEAKGKKTVITADKSGNLLTLKSPSHKLAVTFSGQEDIAIIETKDTFEAIIE